MSFGQRFFISWISIFNDLDHGKIDESFAQELVDQFIIKLRMVHLRMQSYNDILQVTPPDRIYRRTIQRRTHQSNKNFFPLLTNTIQSGSVT